MVFVMLNPSTADADLDDPTIRRCIGFARDTFKAGGLTVVNLFAWRATKPDELPAVGEARAVGIENDAEILRVLADTSVQAVVCAWGSHHFAEARAKHAYPVKTPRSARRTGHKSGQSDRSVSEPDGLTHRVSTRTVALALATVGATSARGSFAWRAPRVSVAGWLTQTRSRRFASGPQWKSSSSQNRCDCGKVTS